MDPKYEKTRTNEDYPQENANEVDPRWENLGKEVTWNYEEWHAEANEEEMSM